MRSLPTPDELAGLVGRPLGASRWHRLSQETVNRFAAVTGDTQWIHVDQERAARGLFRTTVVHGFLLVALLPALLAEVVQFEQFDVVINRGIDRVHFTAPVAVGSRIRARFMVADLRARPRGFHEVRYDAWCDVENGSASVCSARLTLLYQQDAAVSEPSAAGQPARGR